MDDKSYSFNGLLKEIRTDLGYTQKELANMLNCSQELISRIEKGERDIADDLLIKLSTIYKTDLIDYKLNIQKFKSLLDYKAYHELIYLINYENNLKLIEEKLKDEVVQNLDYGEPLLLKRHCMALLESNVHQNFEKTIEITLENLECTLEELPTLRLNTLKSPFYYASLLVLTPALFVTGKKDLAITTTEKFLSHLDEMWDNSFFKYSIQNHQYVKNYVLILNNLAYMYFLEGEYEKSNNICDLTIKKSGNFYTLFAYHHVFKVKIEALYHLGRLEEAKKAYTHLELYCDYLGYDKHLERVRFDLKNSCPDFF